MLKHSGTVLLCGAMLSVGIFAGRQAAVLPGGGRAVAEQTSAESTYASMPPAAIALTESGNHIARISTAVMPSVVHIQARRTENDQSVEETGSGVVMSGPGGRGLYVITNNHVLRGATNQTIDITTSDGRLIRPVRVLRDAETDIAVMEVRVTGLKPARWGDSHKLELGHHVIAVGSPFGLSQSVTMGIISAIGRRDLSLTEDRSVTNQDFLQTDAAINPGNSGGPLLDVTGDIVGINTAIASNSGGSEGIGFSIPSRLASRVFEQLVQHGRVKRAYLGVELDSDFSYATARRLGMDRARGARITRIYQTGRRSPAIQAGLRPDDVILVFNGIDVIDENHLINLVSLSETDKPMRIEFFRAGQRSAINVTLMDRDSYNLTEAPGRDVVR